ncbi:hypothetical protein [Candidatus Magnetominusculus dajiuhuensis]|uniref:hypothetical protein n=1 Tax=Candidatus Magnetominusculus dajiuhuensis TaxID=3137712 RepID=UPI003B438F13
MRSLEIEILDYLKNNPDDSVTAMIILIGCYIRLNDIDNADLTINKCYKLVGRNVPFGLAMSKAIIENIKGNKKEAIAILMKLIKNKKLTEGERIVVFVQLIIYNSNLAYFEEMYNKVVELWKMINHNSEMDFDGNSFYSEVAKYADHLPLISAMDDLKSYLNGKELLKKDDKYSEIYRDVKDYTKDNRLIEDIIPYEEVDLDFPDVKYFSLKLISKPMSVGESHNLEIQIEKLIESKYPCVLVLVYVMARE